GAHHVVASSPDATDAIRTLTEGRGVDVVFDNVGANSTLALAVATLRPDGAISLVGSGGGLLALGRDPSLAKSVKKGPLLTQRGATVALPYWGTRADLAEVVRLAQRGVLRLEVERYPLDAAPDVLDRLRHGRISGRAVLTP